MIFADFRLGIELHIVKSSSLIAFVIKLISIFTKKKNTTMIIAHFFSNWRKQLLCWLFIIC